MTTPFPLPLHEAVFMHIAHCSSVAPPSLCWWAMHCMELPRFSKGQVILGAQLQILQRNLGFGRQCSLHTIPQMFWKNKAIAVRCLMSVTIITMRFLAENI